MSAWHELRLKVGANPRDTIQAFGADGTVVYHHFWDEPWWPDAYVMRVKMDDPDRLGDLPGVDHVEPWDSGPDEKLFGPTWPNVQTFFWVVSSLGDQDPRMIRKLVHCMLNSQGMSEWDEAKFHARAAWDRIRVIWRVKRGLI